MGWFRGLFFRHERAATSDTHCANYSESDRHYDQEDAACQTLEREFGLHDSAELVRRRLDHACDVAVETSSILATRSVADGAMREGLYPKNASDAAAGWWRSESATGMGSIKTASHKRHPGSKDGIALSMNSMGRHLVGRRSKINLGQVVPSRPAEMAADQQDGCEKVGDPILGEQLFTREGLSPSQRHLADEITNCIRQMQDDVANINSELSCLATQQ